MKRLTVSLLLLCTHVLAVAACGPSPSAGQIIGVSEGMRFTVTADSLPPSAQERINYRVVVRDAETGEPVEGGEGQIFASFEVSSDFQHSTGDGFAAQPELGTYSATMIYVAAGLWSVALQFRRDSLSPLARIDWKQEVRPPRPLGG